MKFARFAIKFRFQFYLKSGQYHRKQSHWRQVGNRPGSLQQSATQETRRNPCDRYSLAFTGSMAGHRRFSTNRWLTTVRPAWMASTKSLQQGLQQGLRPSPQPMVCPAERIGHTVPSMNAPVRRDEPHTLSDRHCEAKKRERSSPVRTSIDCGNWIVGIASLSLGQTLFLNNVFVLDLQSEEICIYSDKMDSLVFARFFWRLWRAVSFLNMEHRQVLERKSSRRTPLVSFLIFWKLLIQQCRLNTVDSTVLTER